MTEDIDDIKPAEQRPAKIAIIGRPNVGKSTIFNRLAGKKLAIVNDTPGVTRDVRETRSKLRGHDMVLMDTAGFENAKGQKLEARMREPKPPLWTPIFASLFMMRAKAFSR